MALTHELLLELASRMQEQDGRVTRDGLLMEAFRDDSESDKSPLEVFQAQMHNHVVEEAMWELISQKRLVLGTDGRTFDKIDRTRKEP